MLEIALWQPIKALLDINNGSNRVQVFRKIQERLLKDEFLFKMERGMGKEYAKLVKGCLKSEEQSDQATAELQKSFRYLTVDEPEDTSHLLRLPGELRNRIYVEVLLSSVRSSASLLSTSNLIRSEMSTLDYYTFSQRKDFLSFAGAIPAHTALIEILHLHLQNEQLYSVKLWEVLAKNFPGLKRLELRFSVPYVPQAYLVDKLRRLRCLESVTLGAMHTTLFANEALKETWEGNHDRLVKDWEVDINQILKSKQVRLFQ